MGLGRMELRRAALPADEARIAPTLRGHLEIMRADTDIHPSECRRAFEASAARDKTYAELAGADHYLRPAGADGAKLGDPKDRVADELILPWLGERWPV